MSIMSSIRPAVFRRALWQVTQYLSRSTRSDPAPGRTGFEDGACEPTVRPLGTAAFWPLSRAASSSRYTAPVSRTPHQPTIALDILDLRHSRHCRHHGGTGLCTAYLHTHPPMPLSALWHGAA